MKTKVLAVALQVDISSLPPGEYRGTWGSYEARFEINGTRYIVTTEDGIRTPCAPCIVRIEDGIVTVSI